MKNRHSTDFRDPQCLEREEDKLGETKDSGAIDLAVSTVLMSWNVTHTCMLKFWLLLLGGLLAFFMWTTLLFKQTQLWRPELDSANTFGNETHAIVANNSNIDEPTPTALTCLDIWFALQLMAGVDAFAIVINFNRSLIQQFHYFISLRMTLLAALVPGAVLLLQDLQNSTLWTQCATCLLCCVIYTSSIFFTNRLHRQIPARGMAASRSSLKNYSANLCLFDLSWTQNVLLAAISGAIGVGLIKLVPIRWSMLSPLLHITGEVYLLGLMETKRTPRYVWFASPVVQAATCINWGLRQVVTAPKLMIQPWKFLAIMFGGRLLLDLHLLTVFRRRHDFQWARREVLISTKRLVIAFASMIVLEHLGVPVVTYVKPIAVVILHMSGALAFLLPASYALAFDKIKTIRE